MTSALNNSRIAQRMSSQGNVAYDEQRRNLKTAGRPGGFASNNPSAMMSKNESINSMTRSLVVQQNRTRMGKSSDANAFRRSIIINNGVL